MGDFNLPTLSWSVSGSGGDYVRPVDGAFNDCFVQCGLQQWVEEPTFVSSSNILDLVLTSELDRVLEVEVLDPLPTCDHCPVVCSLVFQFDEVGGNCSSQESRVWVKKW